MASSAYAENNDDAFAYALANVQDVITVEGRYRQIDNASATKTPTPIIDVPQAITVLSRDQIDDQALFDIGDVLQQVRTLLNASKEAGTFTEEFDLGDLSPGTFVAFITAFFALLTFPVRAALRSVFGELIRQDRLVIVKDLELEAPKTKLLATKLKELELDSALILNEGFDEKVFLAARNLPNVGICDVASMDPVVLMRFEKVLVTLPALKLIEERLS